MPEVWHKVLLRGERGEAEVSALFNSGSSFIVLPSPIAKAISPKTAGTAEIELVTGRTIKRKTYEITVELRNEKTTETRTAKTFATIEKRDYPLIGTMAMEKLRVGLDLVKGEILFL